MTWGREIKKKKRRARRKERREEEKGKAREPEGREGEGRGEKKEGKEEANFGEWVLFSFCLFCRAGAGTQGLAHAGQVFYH